MTSQTPVASKEAIFKVVETLKTFHVIIHEATYNSSLGGIPNGHLYAMVMDKMSLELYTSFINKLKELNLITETNHLLRSTK